jgi:hypothetical protein
MVKISGLSHQAIDDQAMVRRVDLGHAAVMALEAEPVGRDDAVQLVQRREADRGFRRRRQPLDPAPHHVAFVFRGRAIGRIVDAGPQVLRPVGHVGRLVLRRGRQGLAGHRRGAAGQDRAAAQKAAAVEPRPGFRGRLAVARTMVGLGHASSVGSASEAWELSSYSLLILYQV